ncbi:MAG: purine-binding chemotaxis protein CheW [Desulfobacterales bacterium]|nr:purine-binding chemotaxis protein CheW [Desulfobacterales bacterium]MBF0396142.1 purine-binding chemotaxis protein CheW [Desulfobacterales bacterium]
MIKEKDTDDIFYDDEDDEDTLKDKYLTFCLGQEEYGIDIKYVIEVIGMQKITEVPDVPDFVKGVINLRGQVIPITDVRMRFKMKPAEYNDRTCVVVVKIKDTQVGLIVDLVSDVIKISEDQVQPPPRINQKEGSRFIQGLGKVDDQVKILLNIEKLLYEEELEKIAAYES